jgi:hypothetical protein
MKETIKTEKDINLVDIGAITSAKIRTSSKNRENNPLNKMYEVFIALLQKAGVKDLKESGITISEIIVTKGTEKLIQKEFANYMKAMGTPKRVINREVQMLALDMPGTLLSSKSEKALGLKDNRVYVVKEALESALNNKKVARKVKRKAKAGRA